ncbi:DUF1715-domain-containing protein [Coniochaeta ligniaria NRRL 30616]|uniref:DUF1715-domain-containing protein n=1 Tax=Coniochaeta ligniaria NRRL 30616 TaxID=1408157 RepID=A0A1J7IQT5_9PEZI|nr:DUF1715-domain-containing protein [Coniochaeta ligniaria NRRL 30616]
MADDPFEQVLDLEEQFYQDGYKQGVADGDKAGRIEGRGLGLEKGYQKFMESGRLHGKSIVWANRLPGLQARPQPEGHPGLDGRGPEKTQQQSLPPLPNNPRLEKNVTTLFALTEPDSLSTDNTDEAVNDFDDRLKRAEGKAKVIEKTVGEDHKKDDVQKPASPGGAKSAGLEV